MNMRDAKNQRCSFAAFAAKLTGLLYIEPLIVMTVRDINSGSSSEQL